MTYPMNQNAASYSMAGLPATGSASGVGTALQGAGAGAGLAGMAGMGAMLGPIGLGIGALGTIANIFESSKARKDAKKAAKEQAKKEAMINLINVAGGGNASQTQMPQQAPQVGYGNALQNLGNLAMKGDSWRRQNTSDDNDALLNLAKIGYYNRKPGTTGYDMTDMEKWAEPRNRG